MPMTDLRERIATSFQAQGLMTTLGAELVRVAEGEVHIALPFSERLSQQHGFVHAGAITSILDSACWYVALTQIKNSKKYNHQDTKTRRKAKKPPFCSSWCLGVLVVKQFLADEAVPC